MKLSTIYKSILREQREELPKELQTTNSDLMGNPSQDPTAEREGEVIVLMNKLGENPEFIAALRQVQDPQAKYKAILLFADMLGIDQDQFHQTIDQFRIQSQQKQNSIDNGEIE